MAEIKELRETIDGLDDSQIMLQNDRLTSQINKINDERVLLQRKYDVQELKVAEQESLIAQLQD